MINQVYLIKAIREKINEYSNTTRLKLQMDLEKVS